MQDAQGKDQYVVSPDGLWSPRWPVAEASTRCIFSMCRARRPVTRVSPDAAVHVSQPRFSQSSALYFLATAAPWRI